MTEKKTAHKKDDLPVVNDADQSVAAIADEEKARLERAKRREEAQPKKKDAPKIAVEEKSGQAVATVDVPAHKAEVSIGHSSVPGVIAATVEAWHKVKGKDDAEFANCLAAFRQDLINHAEELHRSGIVAEGDTVMAKFEQEVAKILKEKAAEAAKAKAA